METAASIKVVIEDETELLDLFINDTCIKILTFFLKNGDQYYTRNQIVEMSTLEMGSLEHYLPKLSNSKYDLLLVKNVVGVHRQNHMKSYKINDKSVFVKHLMKLLTDIMMYDQVVSYNKKH